MFPNIEEPEVPTQSQGPVTSGLFSDLLPLSIKDAQTAFDNFMAELDIMPYLDRTRTRIHSWARGCPMLLVKVTNGNWATERARKSSDGRFTVGDATRFYDVHMEVGVKLGTTKLSVQVHHETSPYIVESKLRTVVDTSSAENYRRRRLEFIEEFHTLCGDRKEEMPDFKLTHRWMLIGSVEYDFAGKTVEEVSKWLAFMIDEIADKINSTTNKLNARARFVAEDDAAVIEPSETSVGEIIADALSVADDVPFTKEEVPFSTTADGEQLPFSI